MAGNVRAARARAKVKQLDLAAALNMSQPVASALENGGRPITFDEVLIICRVLRVSLGELLAGADPGDLRTLGF